MKAEFKTSWTPSDFKEVEKKITKWINSRYFETHHSPNADPFIIAGARTFAQIADILGLPYTSSGIWACYNVTNTNLFLDAAHIWNVEFFTIDTAGFVYAVCWDKDENEISIPI